MGLMDRVREQAAQLAQKTQEAAQEGRVMLDQAQARRRADAMFRDLGAAVYADERAGAGRTVPPRSTGWSRRCPGRRPSRDSVTAAANRRRARRAATPAVRPGGQRPPPSGRGR